MACSATVELAGRLARVADSWPRLAPHRMASRLHCDAADLPEAARIAGWRWDADESRWKPAVRHGGPWRQDVARAAAAIIEDQPATAPADLLVELGELVPDRVFDDADLIAESVVVEAVQAFTRWRWRGELTPGGLGLRGWYERGLWRRGGE